MFTHLRTQAHEVVVLQLVSLTAPLVGGPSRAMLGGKKVEMFPHCGAVVVQWELTFAGPALSDDVMKDQDGHHSISNV